MFIVMGDSYRENLELELKAQDALHLKFGLSLAREGN